MLRKLIIVLFSGIILSNELDKVLTCEYCHSHNDYLNHLPLFNALNHGFKSIEIDVVLHNESLLVAHHWLLKNKNKTIENIYLDNIYDIYNNRGYVYPNSSLILLIDIKTSAVETYEVLDRILDSYRSMLTYVKEDSVVEGSVTVILSGNKPSVDYIEKLSHRYVFLDGRLSDLGKNISVNLMPLISTNWKDQFKWRGKGAITNDELMVLQEIIREVHNEGKKIRFWGSPDNVNAWEHFYLFGIDFINTDKIIKLHDFILQNDIVH